MSMEDQSKEIIDHLYQQLQQLMSEWEAKLEITPLAIQLWNFLHYLILFNVPQNLFYL
ncbi:17104_t:CDS:2 [Funneliformis geosporum]|uniref:8725_t:CDS:1 n=1 Tax=Funneliformis geosporum TaxID=1117311 RepID=A0A9W4T0M9_9GLOM|nr:17104_t:CDS:2 [Funneliformis geosporum]CAI2188299.1 8725_t:CDS:2 [Funneliformis geosporum]